MVISLAPSYLFSSYKSGVFDVDSTTYRALNIKQPEWQKVDHSVVLVGYGIENGKETKSEVLPNQYNQEHEKDNMTDMNRSSQSHDTMTNQYTPSIREDLNRINDLIKKIL